MFTSDLDAINSPIRSGTPPHPVQFAQHFDSAQFGLHSSFAPGEGLQWCRPGYASHAPGESVWKYHQNLQGAV